MKKHFCTIFLIVFLIHNTNGWSLNLTDIMTDLWSYEVTNSQNVLGALGIILLSVNFVAGWIFYTKSKHDAQHILQRHTDDLEDSVRARAVMDERMKESIIKIKMLSAENI